MLECITTLIANLLYDASGGADPDTLDYAQREIGINSEIDHIIDACKESECPVYIVTNELGDEHHTGKPAGTPFCRYRRTY